MYLILIIRTNCYILLYSSYTFEFNAVFSVTNPEPTIFTICIQYRVAIYLCCITYPMYPHAYMFGSSILISRILMLHYISYVSPCLHVWLFFLLRDCILFCRHSVMITKQPHNNHNTSQQQHNPPNNQNIHHGINRRQ
jgi:hypothetical protein